MSRAIGVGVVLAVLFATPGHAETLADAVRGAMASNPTLAAARDRQDALAEAPEQARAAGRLSAEANASGGYDRFGYGKGAAGSVSAGPFALVGFGLGMRMSGKSAVAAANALFLGSAVLGGLWIPSAMLPGWMRAVGEAVPSYHLGQLALGVVGMPVIGSVWTHGTAVAGMTVLAAIWAWTGWRRSPA